MSEPTLKEHFKAMLDVCFGMSVILACSLVIGISRLCFVMNASADYLESIGFFSPWFLPWFFVMLSTAVISLRGPEICRRANKLAAKRLREQYSKIY